MKKFEHQDISEEELASVIGGTDRVPFDAPGGQEFAQGFQIANDGATLFDASAAGFVGAALLPPPFDLGALAFTPGMVDGAAAMDQGEAMMDHASSVYEASVQAPPPEAPPPEPTVVTIDPVVIEGDLGGGDDGGEVGDDGVMQMDPLVIYGGEGGDFGPQ